MNALPGSVPAHNRRIKLLSFNIQVAIASTRTRHYLTQSWKHVLPHASHFDNLDRIAHLVSDYDIVGLQEVDGGSLRSHFVNQVEYLAERSHHPFWHQQTNRNLGRIAKHSNGLLSRFQPSEITEYKLPGVMPGRIGMYGLSQGGESALFLPALDERIAASVSSAYFNTRLPKLIGPVRATAYLDSPEEDKFFSKVLHYFGDADIVSLIAPRAFAVEAGLKDTSVDFELSAAEFQRARVHFERLGIPGQAEFIPHAEGHVSATARAFEFLKEKLI